MSLISTREAASMLVLPTKQVLRLAARGELPYAQKLDGVRGSYLFDPEVVTEYGRALAAEAELRAQTIRAALADDNTTTTPALAEERAS